LRLPLLEFGYWQAGEVHLWAVQNAREFVEDEFEIVFGQEKVEHVYVLIVSFHDLDLCCE
jgi:hypothetical protein